jgi:hypothetical protein
VSDSETFTSIKLATGDYAVWPVSVHAMLTAPVQHPC